MSVGQPASCTDSRSLTASRSQMPNGITLPSLLTVRDEDMLKTTTTAYNMFINIVLKMGTKVESKM